MRANDFLGLYCADGLVQTVAAGISAPIIQNIHIKGLTGSLDAVIASACFQLNPQDYFIVTHDREEAAYVQNDLQTLLKREVLLFPMSYKRPYEFEEIDNANILMRTEVLNRITGKTGPEIIVSYPEALSEKVINKRSLASNTFSVKVGSELDVSFLEEFLHTYNFEKTDFVYEAGQFAVRGGIIDIFSFAHELPYRIELFGNHVESIRSFEPGSQLSVEKASVINIIPDVQSRLVQEERQSLFEFLSNSCVLWFKDHQLAGDVVQKSFDKAQSSFEKILKASGNAQLVLKPESLFDTGASFGNHTNSFRKVEFGNRFSLPDAKVYEWASSPQPAFKKNFELLADNLNELQANGFANFIAAEMPKQLERLTGIFEEIHPELKFTSLEFPLRQGFLDRQQKIAVYTDHQIFERFHRYQAREKFSKSKALTLRELHTLQPGDFVTHIEHGIGKFAGLEKKEVNGCEQEAIRLVYRDDDVLFASIHSLHKISKYTGKEGTPPVISKLGSQEWETKKAKVKKESQRHRQKS
ncbi:CarD family transcriptional regulator [Oscillatoria amoena NRMC-F 0135]|nr:CarD family transcriptional regulator [Oscillatoria amoena NRMC-F 0135]